MKLLLPLAVVTIRLLNPAHVPLRDLAAAERIASTIFRAAGVDLHWVDSDAHDSDFQLQLLDRAPAQASPDAIGFTLLAHQPDHRGSYAAVSWDSIGRLSAVTQFDRAPILGVAIAHELGHLLLDSHDHSPYGVMAAHLGIPQLGMAARGELLFTDAQSRALCRVSEALH